MQCRPSKPHARTVRSLTPTRTHTERRTPSPARRALILPRVRFANRRARGSRRTHDRACEARHEATTCAHVAAAAAKPIRSGAQRRRHGANDFSTHVIGCHKPGVRTLEVLPRGARLEGPERARARATAANREQCLRTRPEEMAAPDTPAAAPMQLLVKMLTVRWVWVQTIARRAARVCVPARRTCIRAGRDCEVRRGSAVHCAAAEGEDPGGGRHPDR